jgi:hypothetical protein
MTPIGTPAMASADCASEVVQLSRPPRQPHPTTGSPLFDASAYARLDTNTFVFTRMKAGKLVGVGTAVVSQDGKTWTVTQTGVDANGRPANSVAVYEKQ